VKDETDWIASAKQRTTLKKPCELCVYRTAAIGREMPETTVAIRQELERSPDLQEILATDSAASHDRKEAENRIEEALYKLRTQAIEDAIASRPPQVPTFQA
jgi:hypothetical protein